MDVLVMNEDRLDCVFRRGSSSSAPQTKHITIITAFDSQKKFRNINGIVFKRRQGATGKQRRFRFHVTIIGF